jgi:mannose-6-phosphate isomerase
MNLYPFTFQPRFVEKMWGGQSLARVADKSLPSGKQIGESWELYDFPPGTVGPDATQPGDDAAGWVSARIANGPLKGESLHSVMLFERAALLGGAQPVDTPAGPQFPLLIKFLDARQDLSVQVHPPADYVRSHPGAALKNECWHILEHDPDARILMGTRPGTTREAFAQSIKDGTCETLLNSVKVQKGDTFYLPSGTVHALGAGMVAAEVQTPSDTTYRVFDFNRVEPSTGKPRKLHVEQALDCIDFDTDALKNYIPPGDTEAVVTSAPQFTLLRRFARGGEKVSVATGELRVLIFLDGSGKVGYGKGAVEFSRGMTVVVPASVNSIIEPQTDIRWLEVQLPDA